MAADRGEVPAADTLSEDAFLGGALIILQPKAGYRAGLDAVLLAAALRAGENELVLDAGSGVGVAGLAAARRLPGIEVTLVEQDPRLVEIARRNIARNGMSGRARAIAADITQPLGACPELHALAERFDHVLANPPYIVEGRGTAASHAAKAAAHAMPSGDLDRWMRFAASMLRPGGTVTLIHRAEALAEVLAAVEGRFGDARVRPMHPFAGKPASRVLVQARKASRAPLVLLPGIVLHEADRSFRADIDAVLRRGAALDAFAER
jgi:tRNA1(Val) A37 N6-methylase TrmN6